VAVGASNRANELICYVRLKPSRAWWLEANNDAILRIRYAIYNGTFRRIFADYIDTRCHRTSSP
jgi:hypothetical protein